ncbi:hypothetical protein [Deefgea sp. CFH1-16]|uniref:hypothetical protein n=1 Tax=Deefgea sp. CFH1-16 TaxID=2675457 RepID=UPI0015F428DD|nr:hypothetical protein [Deefgea sp. CFH1-16]
MHLNFLGGGGHLGGVLIGGLNRNAASQIHSARREAQRQQTLAALIRVAIKRREYEVKLKLC